jgi:aspartate aminotransferase-like enzyme
MPNRRLMTPGPTQVPEEAHLALARQVIHHRTPEFRRLLGEVLDGLKYVFQTELDELDVLSTIAAIELVLVEMGQSVKLGLGVAAAGRVIPEAAGELPVSPGRPMQREGG